MVHESLLEDCVTPACLVKAPAGQQEYMTFTFEDVGPGCSTLRSLQRDGPDAQRAAFNMQVASKEHMRPAPRAQLHPF